MASGERRMANKGWPSMVANSLLVIGHSLPGAVRLYQRQDFGSDAAQKADDAGKIAPAVPMRAVKFVNGGGLGTERGRNGAGTGRILCKLEVLEHHGGGEAGLIIPVRRRRRHRAGHRTVARQRPALPGRFRRNVEQLLRVEPKLL